MLPEIHRSTPKSAPPRNNGGDVLLWRFMGVVWGFYFMGELGFVVVSVVLIIFGGWGSWWLGLDFV